MVILINIPAANLERSIGIVESNAAKSNLRYMYTESLFESIFPTNSIFAHVVVF